MSKANPKVDAWFSKANNWQPEMQKLRSIILGCGLGEELKWYKPVYTFGKKNVVIIIAMKETVALAFCKGALLKDPKHVLARIGENSQAGRWIKFTSVQEGVYRVDAGTAESIPPLFCRCETVEDPRVADREMHAADF